MMLRVLVIGLGLLLAASGGFGLGAVLWPEHAAVEAGRRSLASLTGSLGEPDAARRLEDHLASPVVGGGLLVAGLLFLAGGFWPQRRGEKSAPGPAGRKAAATPRPEPAAPGLDRGTVRRVARQATALARKGELREAAELCAQSGLLDEAAAHFEAAGELVRAAEIRHDQHRFGESAELYLRAGQIETAGTIFAAQNDHGRAADCYLKAGRLSVAAEMFEKAGDHRRAGECYAESGFQRHAAHSFVRARDWERAARSLEEVILEEGSRSAGVQTPRKEQELRKLVLQAGKLYEQAGNLEAAARVLEKGGCHGAAGEIALRLGQHARAAELFGQAGEALRAAEALRQIGEEVAAARILGEWSRDRGDDEAAAQHFIDAGEYIAAGDLFRKLEAYDRAGECYEQQGDSLQAAEMFRLAGYYARAATNYEAVGRYDEAAECCETTGDRVRQASLLGRAGRLYAAACAYRSQGLDDEAIRALQQVEAGSPDSARACSLLGEIFHDRGQYGLAIAKLRQALGDAEVSRENLDVFLRLGRVYEANHELREAASIYERILGVEYHHTEAEARLASLRGQILAISGPLAAASHGLSTSTGRPGRYRMLDEVGRGGMGIVYRAEDTVLDRIVALKVLPDALRENPQALRNFLREAKSAAKLNHPNIVTVYDAGEQDGRYYIAMEFVDGTTLKSILRKKRLISPSGALYVLVQMCEALGYAHEQKVIHRDVKTANTMWTRDRKAKIMDFGLAKVVEEVRNHTTLVSGTPYYMSPEQTLGRNVDHRTDIYSLGVTLFELCTGILPFREGNIPYHHVHTPAPDPRTVIPDLPLLLARIIARCLQKDPGARYQSTREILDEVRASRSGTAQAAPGV
jgi:tetratricopeptide (TPR) repeat protein